MAFYSSNGKILLTGEYLVLEGALALGLPTRFGQTLEVEHSTQLNGMIEWAAFQENNLWFNALIDIEKWEVVETGNPDVAGNLLRLLQKANSLTSAPLMNWKGYKVVTRVDYPLEWGLGSSSTLISNIAYWLNINPMDLHDLVASGSAYDIACARSSMPLAYQKIENSKTSLKVSFSPVFHENLFFVYTGNKQSSEEEIKYFEEKTSFSREDIYKISQLTRRVILAQQLQEFEKLITTHEHVMSGILKRPPIKETHFGDYPGSIKSLGAWGGDFILVTGKRNNSVKEYFNSKGLSTIFPYKDMVI